MGDDDVRAHLEALKRYSRECVAEGGDQNELRVKKAQLLAIHRTIDQLERQGIPVPESLSSERASLASAVDAMEDAAAGRGEVYDVLLDIVAELGGACGKRPHRAPRLGLSKGEGKKTGTVRRRSVAENLELASQDVRDRFEALKSFLLALGGDVQFRALRYYFTFSRTRCYASVLVHHRKGEIVVLVWGAASGVSLEEGFTRDMRGIAHFGQGDLEIVIRTDEDLRKAQPLLIQSYEAS